jgi:hypothetical protein
MWVRREVTLLLNIRGKQGHRHVQRINARAVGYRHWTSQRGEKRIQPFHGALVDGGRHRKLKNVVERTVLFPSRFVVVESRLGVVEQKGTGSETSI